jgi:hypothetical protein
MTQGSSAPNARSSPPTLPLSPTPRMPTRGELETPTQVRPFPFASQIFLDNGNISGLCVKRTRAKFLQSLKLNS